jgi:LysM repeat protein
MKRRSLLLATAFGCLLAFVVIGGLAASPQPAAAAPLAQAAPYITVTVQPGDFLARYTFIYGVSGPAIVAANPLPDPNLIFPGQVITIPVARTNTPSLTTPFYYLVQPGDTLASIAGRFEMDPSLIVATNKLPSDVVVAGATLLIPAGPHRHYAVAGETLKRAARYGTTVEFLLRGNSLPNPDLIYIGQPIFIPIQYNAQPIPITDVPAAPAPTAAPATATAAPGATAVPPTATPAPTAVPGTENYIRVTVRTGESFLTYVTRYGVSGGRLRIANPQILNPHVIHPGDVVIVPVVSSSTPSRTTPFFYVVQAGETAAALAARFEMTADTLTRANPGASFAAGSTVLVPAGPHLYTVKAGETLAAVAAKYGTTVEFLLTGNSLPNPNAVFPGQQIFIPIQFDKAPVPFS